VERKLNPLIVSVFYTFIAKGNYKHIFCSVYIYTLCWTVLNKRTCKYTSCHFFDISKKERVAILVHKKRKDCSCFLVLKRHFGPESDVHFVHRVHILDRYLFLDRCLQIPGCWRTLTPAASAHTWPVRLTFLRGGREISPSHRIFISTYIYILWTYILWTESAILKFKGR